MRQGSWLVLGVVIAGLACKPASSGGTGSGGSSSGSSDNGTGGTGTSAGGSGASGGSSTGGPAVCQLHQTLCDGGCVTTLTDPLDCGSCGRACSASEVCVGGTCGPASTCPEGTVACGTACSDPLSDPLNCGGCGHPCPALQGCANGSCVAAVVLDGGAPSCPAGGPTLPAIGATGASGGDAGGPTCAGALAQINFRFGLCSCGDVSVNGLLSTDRFDSSAGPYVDGGVGAAVGVNGSLTSNANLQLGGACVVAAAGGLIINADSALAQDLDVNGPLTIQALTTVGGSVRVNGDVIANSQLTIAKDLYLPDGATVNLLDVSAAQVVRGPVVVPPPCDCTPDKEVDIAGLVAAAKLQNDDAVLGLAPGTLSTVNAPARLDLPCGRYYLDSVQPSADLTIAIHGPVLLFVGGDLQPNAALQFAVDPSASLDLFIGGNLITDGSTSFGSTLVPAQTRVYVAGPQATFNGAALVAGNFYLPGSTLTPNGSLHLYGSIFAGGFTQNAGAEIHFDSAILAAGATCNDAGTTSPPGGCRSCRDCLNQACVAGTCGACKTSADCCTPLVCQSGACLPPNF